MDAKTLDFDEEAQKLFLQLKLDANAKVARYNQLDPIWKHPSTGGVIYVGNRMAAADLRVLGKHGITHVVNCTENIPNFHSQKGVNYHQFPISYWPRHVKSGDKGKSCIKFVQPVFDFIDQALSKGESVLVHCLAGAHRAGTTGCLCLMHYGDFKFNYAVKMAQKLRPAINPIGQLPGLLLRYEKAREYLASV